MKYRIKTFGITKEILGAKEVDFEMDGNTVGALRNALANQYPDIKSLNSLMIAINNAYADDGTMVSETDEIALIPPVSGG